MNLARLNHILIPATRDGRERVRRSAFGKLLAPLGWLFGALSSEGRALSVLLLFVGTAGLSVDTTQIHVLWSVLLGLSLGVLIARRSFAIEGARLQVRAPRRVAVGQAVTFELALENERSDPLYDLRLSYPFLPWDGAWVTQPPSVAVVAGQGRASVVARARFVARGEHQLDVFEASRLVPSGLALGPAIESEVVRFLVVPRIANVARLELPTPREGTSAIGNHVAHARGDEELLGVRPYRYGDPVRELHHRTWARLGEPHIREYRPIASSRLALVLDYDPALVSEEAFEALLSLTAGIVAQAATLDLDYLGLASAGVVYPMRSPRGRAALDETLDRLAVLPRAPLVPLKKLDDDTRPWLARATVVLVVTTCDPTRSRALAAVLSQTGAAVRVVRVVDDIGWLSRRRGVAPGEEAERVLSARAIMAGEAVRA